MTSTGRTMTCLTSLNTEMFLLRRALTSEIGKSGWILRACSEGGAAHRANVRLGL